jgi:hypothetical protein
MRSLVLKFIWILPAWCATINIMLEAVKAQCNTVSSCGQGTAYFDLANMLNVWAQYSWRGHGYYPYPGVQRLHGCSLTVIPDQIETGTLMIARQQPMAISPSMALFRSLEALFAKSWSWACMSMSGRRLISRCVQRKSSRNQHKNLAVSRFSHRSSAADGRFADHRAGNFHDQRNHF